MTFLISTKAIGVFPVFHFFNYINSFIALIQSIISVLYLPVSILLTVGQRHGTSINFLAVYLDHTTN